MSLSVQTDGQLDITKLLVDFRSFAKRLKIYVLPKGCIYVFCTVVRTNRSYFRIQLGMVDFCKYDGTFTARYEQNLRNFG
jgi:hypothetical protein